MAEIQSQEAYELAAQIDADLTQKIIPEVDKYLKHRGLTSTCSDTDSIQLELFDKYLIQLEFRSEINRGSGQQRMWKNAASKRHTSTIIAYRKSLFANEFYKIEFYSCLGEHGFWQNGLYDYKGIANAFRFEIKRILIAYA